MQHLKKSLKTQTHTYIKNDTLVIQTKHKIELSKIVMRIKTRPLTAITLYIGAAALLLTGCGPIKTEAKYPTGYDRSITGDDNIYEKTPGIFGDSSGILSRKKDDEDNGASGLAINSYLWRASLDTISFMPLASADPFGGVILTDWYSNPKKPKERFKINIFILDKQLRSDGVKVKVFNEVLTNGRWTASTIAEGTARKLEDTILTRARQLRVAGLEE